MNHLKLVALSLVVVATWMHLLRQDGPKSGNEPASGKPGLLPAPPVPDAGLSPNTQGRNQDACS